MSTQHASSRFSRFRNTPWRNSQRTLLMAFCLGAFSLHGQTNWTVVGWNNLGMHCMDADFSVFCILPPYNVVNAQAVNAPGTLVGGDGGVSITYQAVADPSGSINTTSVGKNNFWEYVLPLFWLSLPPDVGLPVPGPNSFAMPGVNNTPQAMAYDATAAWFGAFGIPITPYDDAGNINRYPMMRLVAKSGSTTVAQTDIVLPNAEEMNCRACHGSGSGLAAQPADGWVNLADKERDYRLNILRLHDDRQLGTPLFTTALVGSKYNPAGLYTTVVADGNPILCASCHHSEALPGSGYAGVPPLTESIHSQHASAIDPANGLLLDAEANRTSCYYCHPGQATRCLRGVMGTSVAANGSLAMECQSCHGGMTLIGAATRTGWLNEPNCQACHSGDATANAGQIRYTSVFQTPNVMRVSANQRFATTPNAPVAGSSLFRYSRGHGGLYCSACHGSTHAEFPSIDVNDNITSLQHQGYVGVLAECQACHGATQPSTVTGGPHGLHPMGQTWVSRHQNNAGATCQVCHGTDYRGTVLSRTRGDRSLSASGTKTFWRGFQIGCYACHNGPGGEGTPPAPAAVTSRTATTPANTSVAIPLTATGAGTLTLRVVSQTPHGRVGLSGLVATYYPDAGFSGKDTFTFAAWNGTTDSNLGTVTVTVGTGTTCTYTIAPASATLAAGAGSGTVAVTTASGCAWSVVNSVPWVTISSGASGSGPGSVSYTYTANTASASRSAALTIAGQPFNLTQAGLACTYSLTPTGAAVSGGTGSGSVTVNTSANCAWTANSSASWLTVTGGASGTGQGTVTYAIAANPNTASRTGTMTIAGLVYTVTQAGSTCTYTIAPVSASVGAGTGNGSVAVATSSSTCAWTASSAVSWLTITSGASGTGSGTVTYSVAANTSASSRVGTLTIAGRSFTVTQSGVVCTYAITPTTASLHPAATNGIVEVATEPTCSWTASSSVPWITIASGASGTGNGTVRYSVAANTTSVTRNGSLSIAGLTFVVTQTGSGSVCTYLLTPASVKVSASSATGSFQVTTGGSCRWTARSSVSWLTISSGSSGTGTGTVRYSVGRNSYSRTRTGTITVGDQTFTVYQAAAAYQQSAEFGDVSIYGLAGHERITAELIVRNDSGAPLQKLRPVVYLSDNADKDASDVLLWGRTVQNLTPGESSASKFRLTLPSGVSAHGKYLIADIGGEGPLKPTGTPTVVYGPMP